MRTVADIPIVHCDQVTSTHDVARQIIMGKRRELDLSGVDALPGQIYGVVHTDFQSQGRGRRSRTWETTPQSSMLATFILGLRHDNPMRDSSHLLVNACEYVRSQGVVVSLKWPNDIVIDDVKVGGCLSDIVEPFLCVGIGININPHAYPVDLSDVATSLNEHEFSASRDDLLDAIVTRYVADGQSDVWSRYRDLSATIGNDVRIEKMNESFDAHALDVADDGGLIVERDGQREIVYEGDVIHLRKNHE